jgi:hypothetical protein
LHDTRHYLKRLLVAPGLAAAVDANHSGLSASAFRVAGFYFLAVFARLLLAGGLFFCLLLKPLLFKPLLFEPLLLEPLLLQPLLLKPFLFQPLLLKPFLLESFLFEPLRLK